MSYYVCFKGWTEGIDQLILFNRPIHQQWWLYSGIDGVCSIPYNPISAHRKYAFCVSLNAGVAFERCHWAEVPLSHFVSGYHEIVREQW